MVVVVMGVSGVRKTHIGKLVAESLDIPFFDADDFHPEANVKKMAGGNPLTDEDRWPWLDILAANIDEWNQAGGAVLACSALREIYREKLTSVSDDVRFVMLKADRNQIMERMSERSDHYMPPSLLDSQINTLEEIDGSNVVMNDGTPEEVASRVLKLVS